MSRSFFSTALLVVMAGWIAAQGLVSPSQAQTRSRPQPEPALVAPPLIVAQGAEVPIGLREASVEVETDGGLARMVLSLTLYNPNDRQLEGSLELPLQAGQQVSGFALDVGGEMRDAVPVPKQQAQQVFESIERRGVDPGLLEQTSGNQFRLRVYPIPPRGIRRVRLVIDEAMRQDRGAWRLDVPVQLLAGAESFRLSLRAQGLGQAPEVVGSFDGVKFERRAGAYAAMVERTSFRPKTGLALRFPASNSPQVYVQRVGDARYALVELALPPSIAGAIAPPKMPKAIGLLWDASGSARHRDLQSELNVLDRYFQAVGNGRVDLRVLRDVGEDAGTFEIRDGDWSALRRALQDMIYDGASDLSDWSPRAGIDAYLLVSDGLHNYGVREFPRLSGNQSLIALNSAGARSDSARLTALTEARGGRVIAWQGRDGANAAVADLLSHPSRIVSVQGDGIEALQPQDWRVGEGPIRIAGRLTEPTATIRIVYSDRGRRRALEAEVIANAPASSQVAALWANWRVSALAAEPERYRGEVTRIGREFGVVTPGTSLLVLENVADYVRYDIPAPPALAAEVDALRRRQAVEKTQSRSQRLEEVALRFQQRATWWKQDFPKDSPPVAKHAEGEALDRVAVTGSRVEAQESRRDRRAERAREAIPRGVPAPSAPPAAPPPSPMPILEAAAAPGDGLVASGGGSPAGVGVSIKLQAWAPDSPYARRLRDAKAEDVYAVYLDERDSHADSTAFYLDVADLLLKKGRRAEALRVLSNLAELDLENRHVLRVLGYRLMQARDYARAIEVFREVLRLAEEEPQSHRDLGLALAANGERQEAIERLYEVAARPWDARFSEVELVALNEMNAIIAVSPKPLDTAFVDRRLLMNMPLDLRVVLAWDSDNSDMDLWVTDPNGERCYYGHRNTYQGGLISDDFTGGYGPEEFVLKDAKPGKYKVEANFFGDRQQIVTGATTLSLTFSTGWGTPRQQDEAVVLRLKGQSETVFVGEFEVK